MSIAKADSASQPTAAKQSALAEAFNAPGMQKLVLAGGIGTVLERYDYFLYNFIAPLAFEKLFFPKFDPTTGLIALYATFAVGFVASPLGAIVFGHFGDKIGRKRMMLITLLMMGMATTCIGLLPTYDQIGVAAIVILVCLRFIQGFAQAGELNASSLLILESSVRHRRGLTGSFMQLSGPVGLLMATFTAYLVARLPDNQLLTWGWRAPFLLGFLLIGVGIYIRLSIEESPAFRLLAAKQAPPRIPAFEAFAHHKRQIFTVFFLTAAESSFFLLTAVFAISYMTKTIGLDRDLPPLALVIANCLALITMPFFGGLSDWIGRKKIYMLGLFLALGFFFVYFNLLATKTTLVVIASVVIAVGIIDAMMVVIQASFFLEMFPTRVRFTGVAIGRQFGQLVGGISPVVAASLMAYGESGPRYIVYYYSCLAIVALAALMLAKDTRDRDILE
jgi:MHS family shikimate/dehydroshikimate transporter-like MFS transporter